MTTGLPISINLQIGVQTIPESKASTTGEIPFPIWTVPTRVDLCDPKLLWWFYLTLQSSPAENTHTILIVIPVIVYLWFPVFIFSHKLELRFNLILMDSTLIKINHLCILRKHLPKREKKKKKQDILDPNLIYRKGMLLFMIHGYSYILNTNS